MDAVRLVAAEVPFWAVVVEVPKPAGAVVVAVEPAVVAPVVPGADVTVSDGAAVVVAAVVEDEGPDDAVVPKRLATGAAEEPLVVAAADGNSEGA